MPYKNLEDKRLHDKRYVEKRKEAAGANPPFMRQLIEVKVKGPAHGLRIAVLPDMQVRPGVPLDHLKWIGQYVAEKQPDVIVQIGDFCDMPSLSQHDAPGSVKMEGKRYKSDLECVHRAMETLTAPWHKMKKTPKMVLTLGNHEDRITRLINRDAKLQGLISLEDLHYKEAGWEVYPFLQPVVVGGVAFCHYFPSGAMGRPIGSAKKLLTTLHMSAFAGHQQGRDIAYSHRADGTDLTAIISGSCYLHAEEYMSPFTNNHWRGLYFLQEVKGGCFDEMAVSLAYLKRKFA